MSRRLAVGLAGAGAVVVASLAMLGPGASRGSGTAAAKSPAEAPWSVATSPFGLSFRTGSGVVSEAISSAAGPGGRLGYALSDGSFHQLTSMLSERRSSAGRRFRVATDEPGRVATVDVTPVTGGTRVSLRFQPARGIAEIFEAFRSSAPGERFLGAGGSATTLDLGGQIVPVKVDLACGRSVSTPFFVSSAGYGVYFDTTTIGRFEFRGSHDGTSCPGTEPECPVAGAVDRVQACFKASSLSYDVFTGTPTQIVRSYRTAAGRGPIPPVDEFGLIKWRDKVAGAGGLLDDIRRLEQRRIPIRSVLLDNPWEESGCLGALTFDAKAFPDPARLVRAIHEAGVKLMVWVSPYVTATPRCERLAGYASGETVAAGRDAYGRPVDIVDFTSPAARKVFAAKIAALVKLGVDGFKGDRGDEVDLETARLAHGPGSSVQNAYPALFASTVVSAARSAGAGALTTMFRAASAGTPEAGAAVWAGDQTPDFAGLRAAIHTLVTLGASGFSITGSDIGGYAGNPGTTSLAREAFVRWSQLGAVSPIFEVGGASVASRFWTLGPTAVRLFRDSAILHYELFPYLYDLARSGTTAGAPILAPLGLTWPDDPRAWQNDLELTVGGGLLVAPVTTPGTTPSVYLPSGTWTDLFAGRQIAGGQTVVRTTPLDQFPLYLRSGTAIPFNLRAPSIFATPWPVNALQVTGRAGWLYAPGPRAANRTVVGAGTLRAVRRGAGIAIALTDAPHETEVLIAMGRAPSSIAIGGRNVEAISATALRHAKTGWLWVSGPFPGVLVKLAPTHGVARFEVRE